MTCPSMLLSGLLSSPPAAFSSRPGVCTVERGGASGSARRWHAKSWVPDAPWGLRKPEVTPGARHASQRCPWPPGAQ